MKNVRTQEKEKGKRNSRQNSSKELSRKRTKKPDECKVIIPGDSLTKNPKGRLTSKKHRVTCHSHSGCKTTSLSHYVHYANRNCNK